jgi:hypothetical protein
LSLWVPGPFEVAGCPVCIDDCGEGGGGGYEECLHGEGEGAEGREAFMGGVHYRSALGMGVSNRFEEVRGNGDRNASTRYLKLILTITRPSPPPMRPPRTVAL